MIQCTPISETNGLKVLEKLEKPIIVVCGGGINGAFIALELANQLPNSHIILLEKGPCILPPDSTSQNQSYRVHIGAHYLKDLETATDCLEAATKLLGKIPIDCIEGGSDLMHPARRGRYVFLREDGKSSIREDILSKLNTLKGKYKAIVEADPENNAVLGPVDSFFNILEDGDPDIASEIPFEGKILRPELVVETCESQINIAKLQQYLEKALRDAGVTVMTSHEIIRIERDNHSFDWLIYTTEQGTLNIIKAALFVNATWQNIETIAPQPLKESPHVRMKVSIKTEWPEELKNFHTTLFAVGPYCSITRAHSAEGKEIAIITSERATNVATYQGEMSQELREVLPRLTLNDEYGSNLAHEIFDQFKSFTKYGPKLKAEILDLPVGYVLMMDNQIDARRRQEPMVSGLGNITCGSLKMTFAVEHAETLAQKAKHHLQLRQQLETTLSKIPKQKKADILSNRSEIEQRLLAGDLDLQKDLTVRLSAPSERMLYRGGAFFNTTPVLRRTCTYLEGTDLSTPDSTPIDSRSESRSDSRTETDSVTTDNSLDDYNFSATLTQYG